MPRQGLVYSVTVGFWSSSGSASSGTGWVSACQNAINLASSYADVSDCQCLIAAAALAVIAWIFALLAALTACIAQIRRFGVVLSGIGAFFALLSLIIYAAKLNAYLAYVSAGWPCEIIAFVFFVVQAILFIRIKSGSESGLELGSLFAKKG
jgi:hypothetical protein